MLTAGGMLSFEDKVAIQELSARYVLAIDDGDGDARAETFLADGVFEGGGGRFEGRTAIAAQTTASRRDPQPNRWGALPGETQHWVQNYVIDGAADQAIATAYVALVHVTGRILLVGRYYDTLRKVDGRWFFAARRFEISGSASNA